MVKTVNANSKMAKYTLSDFDDIRPYSDGEMQDAFRSLIADRQFSRVLKGLIPWCPVGLRDGFLKLMFKGINSPQDFQVRFMKKVVWYVLKKGATGHSFEYDKSLNKQGAYTFISNHRDIVLDSAILDYMLHCAGFAKTCEIAIGNNLLIYPWIKTLVRMNKAFVVNRGLTPKETLKSSIHMSKYMHFAINQKKENIWIAQREGRAKDSNDLTQESVLKMLVLGYENDNENNNDNDNHNENGNGNEAMNPVAKIIAAIKDMNLVPLTLSYELDPCDYLKAQEFQLKRDVSGWKKAKQDDLDNMKIGIFGKKGHVHFHAAACINDWLDTLDPNTISKADIYRIIAEHIDHEIHSNYRIYEINRDAASGKKNDYIEERIKMVKVDNPDVPFLREKISTMYANPLINYEKATK